MNHEPAPGSGQDTQPGWQFRVADVLPLEAVFSADLYHSAVARLLIFFSLFPMVIGMFSGLFGFGAGLGDVAWLLGIYYACIWGVILRSLINPDQFSWSKTFTCILFTILIGIPLLLLLQRLPPFNLLYASIRLGGTWSLLGFVLGVGALEEAIKALPVYLFLVNPGTVRNPLSTAFYGAMSGLGFAISEGVNYSFQYATGLGQGLLYSLLERNQASLGASIGTFLLVSTIRFVCLPLFHAIWAGILGYFLGLSAHNPQQKWTVILVGWAIAAVLHGLYNTFSDSVLGLLVMTLSILLFLTYLRRSQKLSQGNHSE